MNYHYIDAVCEDPTYGGPYNTSLGWFKDTLVLGALETPQDMYQGNTNAVVYSGPECQTLGFCESFESFDFSPSPSYDMPSSSSSSGQPPGFHPCDIQPKEPYTLSKSDEEWVSQAYDNALENILRSYGTIAPLFLTSHANTCEDYFPPSSVIPYPTSEPQEVDHVQQGVALDAPHLYQVPPVVDGMDNSAGYGNWRHPCHLPCLPLPIPGSLPSPPLPIPGHLPLPPGIPTNHTRPFHEGKETIRKYSVQPRHDSFQEQVAKLKQSETQQDGPSEPSGSYAHRITDKHFRPLDLSKKRKRAVRRPTNPNHIIRLRLPNLDEPQRKKRKITDKDSRAPVPRPTHQNSLPESSTSAVMGTRRRVGHTVMTVMDRNECFTDCFQAQPQELSTSTPFEANISETGRPLASRYILETGQRGENEVRRIRACGID